MRFLRLHLRPYGAFKDLPLDFSAARSGPGLHLIYGPNGAGKSTTLDALRSVLFGIDLRRSDSKDFRFVGKDLRIGARLVRANGEELRYTRRTGRSVALWNEEDDAALEAARITPFLGGLDRDRFATLFGLDLEAMVQGGNDLLEGKGDMGRALFGAGLGGKALSETFKRLDSESSGLWAPRSAKPQINGLLAEHVQLSKELRQSRKLASAYRSDRRELTKLREEAEVEREARRQAVRSVESVERLARAATLLGPLEAKQRQREALGTAPALDLEMARDVQERLAAAEQLARDAATREAKIRALGSERVALRARAIGVHLAATAEIDALSARRGTFREATVDVVTARAEAQEATAARDEAARRAGLGGGEVAGAGGPSSAPAQDAPHDDLVDALDRHRDRLQRARLDRERCAKEQKLARAASQRATDDLDGFHDEAQVTFALSLEELAPWSGTIGELSTLSVPSAELVSAHAEAAARLADRRGDLKRQRSNVESEVRDEKETLARLDRDPLGRPPSATELEEKRRERDRRLEELLERAVSGASVEPAAALALVQIIAAADQLADRIAVQSRRVEERSGCLARLERLAERTDQLGIDGTELERAERAASAAWHELWDDERLAQLDAVAMKVWLERRRSLLGRVEDARGAAKASERSARTAFEERSAELEVVEEELAAATTAWNRWSASRGLDPDAGPEVARVRLQALADLRSHERDVRRADDRAAKAEATIRTYARDVADACERLRIHVESPAPGGTEDPELRLTEARIQALLDAAVAAKRADAELAGVERQLAAETESHRLEAVRAEEIERWLAECAARAGLESRSELVERAGLADRIHAVEIERADLDTRFAETAGGRSAEEIRAAMADREIVDLESEAAAQRTRIEALDESAATRNKRIWEIEALVEGAGSDEAATLESKIALVESELEEAVESFVQARLARSLLDREVDRYRRSTQQPLLLRAQELFEVLTLGAYEKLHPSESKGHEVIVARRPDGSTVQVEGMSTGTRDQLFLALRIASVEHMLHVAKVEPMPFIADDLFVNFDDERTEAALRVLAELSRSTQVIVFTHHASVKETARRLTDEGVAVDVLELEAEAARESAGEHAPPRFLAGRVEDSRRPAE